jgi:hypothetical protein
LVVGQSAVETYPTDSTHLTPAAHLAHSTQRAEGATYLIGMP